MRVVENACGRLLEAVPQPSSALAAAASASDSGPSLLCCTAMVPHTPLPVRRAHNVYGAAYREGVYVSARRCYTPSSPRRPQMSASSWPAGRQNSYLM